MKGKTLPWVMLTMLLIGTLTLAVDVQPTEQAFASSIKGTSLLLNGGFELWSGTPLLPDGWFNVTSSLGVHRSTIAHSGGFSLRLGGENTSEVGWNLAVIMAQDVPVSVGVSCSLAYYAFGRNPWGTLAGGISVYWLNASKGEIGVAIPRVSLPTGGVLSYTSFAGASGSAPSGAVYARINIEKKSYGFINFDDVTFATTDIWPMLQHDKNHTGYSLDTNIYPVPPLSKIWEYRTGYLIKPPPVVSKSGVYVPRADGLVYKLDPATGLPPWKSPTNVSAGIHVSLAVNEGIGQLYVASLDGRLRAINTSTGSIIWTYTVLGAPKSWSAPIFSGGNVYAGSEDCFVYKISGGTLIWRFQPPAPVAPVDWVALESGIVYAAANVLLPTPVFRLYAFNDATPPTLVWIRNLAGSIGPLAVAYGKVYVCQSSPGTPHLYAFDAATGAPVWDKPNFSGPFAVAYGNIYISVNNQVYAFDASTGSPVPGWTVYTALGYEDALYHTVVANGVVYAVFQAFERKSIIVALDAYTGDKLWELTADSFLSPVIAQGSLYISSSEGVVYDYSYNPDIPPTRFVDAIAVWSHNASSTNLYDIYYSIYDATNNTWWTLAGTPAAPIANLAGNDYFPAIAFDHSRNAIAVWSHNASGSAGYDIYYSHWRGSAVGWTTPLPIASLTGDDLDPAIALWKDGKGMAVWCHNGEMWYATWTGAWSTPAKLVTSWPSNLTVYYKQPEITYDANHNAITVWTDGSAKHVYYSVFFNGTVVWTSPAPISAQPDGAAVESRKGIASDRLGNAKVAWNEEGISWDNQYALWNGTAFGPANVIYSGSAGLGTAIAFDAANNAIAIHGTSAAFGNVWCNQEVGGVWQPTQLVSSSPTGREPRTAFLVTGKDIAVWCGPGPSDPDIFYSIWDPSSGTWTTRPVVSTGLPGTDAPGQGPVSIASSSGSPTMPPLIFGVVTPPVGGIWVPVNKFGLLAPYIALASTIVSAIVATTIFIKLKKRKQ